MAYIVPDMKLLPQTMTMSCWYASAQMIVQWRRNRYQMCDSSVKDPAEDFISEMLKKTDNGITDDQIVGLAQRLGLKLVPPMSPTPQALEEWLQLYGPLWTNGSIHITVIGGISGDKALVYDPFPVNKGKVEWRTLSGWYVGNAVDSRDTRTNSGVFMHCPF